MLNNASSDCFCTSAERRSRTFRLLPAGVLPLPSAPWQDAHFALNVAAASASTVVPLDWVGIKATANSGAPNRTSANALLFPEVTISKSPFQSVDACLLLVPIFIELQDLLESLRAEALTPLMELAGSRFVGHAGFDRLGLGQELGIK